MAWNLLTSVAEKTRDVPIGEAALYALLGYAVVFIGIAFLILVVWAIGKGMTKVNTQKTALRRETKPENTTAQKDAVTESLAVADGEELSEETVAVIMAALTAYYQKTNPKCEFTVRRIKKS